ncbi:MAG: tetratricopeptide repeat protein [Terriglobia bacterium]
MSSGSDTHQFIFASSGAGQGNSDLQVGNWRKAQELYQKANDIQPENLEAINNLAYVMLDHGGNVDVALSLAQDARRLQPKSPGVADTLAWAYYRKGDYASAISYLNEALKGLPNDPDVQYHLGMAYDMNKQRAQAVEHLERVLKLNPNFAKADEVRKTLAVLHKG